MTSKYVVDFYTRLEKRGVNIWIDGGWGVDALLGEQTRPHSDLDIVIQQKDVPEVCAWLQAEGYSEIRRDNPWNFVMEDIEGHKIDFHVVIFDEQGDVIEGIPYPDGSLTGTGTIDGCRVRCIAPEHMVQFHTGYELRESDVRDVSALCKRFGIPLPEEYT